MAAGLPPHVVELEMDVLKYYINIGSGHLLIIGILNQYVFH